MVRILVRSPDIKIKYLNYEDFLRLLFGLLEEQFNYDPADPLPNYRKENPEELHKILELMKNDLYYPLFYDKAAYLFISIIENHIYSNGNKRLAFVSFLYFMIVNGYELKQDKPGDLKNLAIFIADKTLNQKMSFNKMKEKIASYLRTHTQRGGNIS